MSPAGNFAATGDPVRVLPHSRSISVNDFRDAATMSHTETSILLIRHGETEWNRSGRVQGWRDSALSEAGVAQAQALAARLADEAVERLVSSDLGRARATAAPIAARLGLAVALDPGLRERNYGMLEGRTYPEIARDHPEVYANITRRDPAFVIPHGESGAAFAARVLGALGRIAGAHPGLRVAVVTHGGVLGVLYRHVMQVTPDAERNYALANASINRIRFGAGGWSIERWGDVAHLALDAADDPVD
jgi:probable phosphoglycerate mutase